MSAKAKASDSQIIGSGGMCAKVTSARGVVTAELVSPFTQLGVLVIGPDMFVRLAGQRRVFHATVSKADTVKFFRLTKAKRVHYQKIISNLQLEPGQHRMFRMIFYGESTFD